MKPYLKLDPWNIVEEDFQPHLHEISESIFSIGNGYMGQRANFEESYSGPSLQGSYMAKRLLSGQNPRGLVEKRLPGVFC